MIFFLALAIRADRLSSTSQAAPIIAVACVCIARLGAYSFRFCFFTVTRRDTFMHLMSWLEDVKQHGNEEIKTALIANKSDLAARRQGEDLDSCFGPFFLPL
jgi:hypothetical protein